MEIEKTVMFVIFLITIAILGAWDSAKCRHKIKTSHRRRHDDIGGHSAK